MPSEVARPHVPMHWPLALLLAGLAAAAVAGLWQRQSNEVLLQQRLQATAVRVADQLRRRMQVYEYGLLGARGAVTAMGPDVEATTREQFHRWAASQDLARQYPGARGFGFIRRVPVHEEAAFMAEVRGEGARGFHVHQIQPHGDERFVITYVEPLQGNQAAVGLDVASEPARRAAALAAMASGEARLTAPITLLQADQRSLRSFLLLLPAYRTVVPPDPAQRTAQTFGWAYAALVTDEVLQDFRSDDEAVALALADVTPPASRGTFFTTADWQPATVAQGHAGLTVFGRQWDVQVQPLPAFAQRLNLRPPWEPAAWVAAIGALLALLLWGLLREALRERAVQARILQLNASLEEQVRRRTEELQRVSARERAIVANAASAIVTADLAGRVTSLNPAAERMLRLPAAQAEGRLLREFYGPGELQEELEPPGPPAGGGLPPQLRRALLRHGATAAVGEDQRQEWSCVRADGTQFPGLMAVSLLRDAAGQPFGFLVVIADLSERRRMEDVLRERTRQAEAASRAKSSFLAHMSHEIRTPLNAVIGLSQLLARMELPERALGFVGHIAQAGEQLLALTNDVLDLSRIEAGEVHLEHAPFELPALLQAVQGIVSAQAQAKGLGLLLDAPALLPGPLLGDALRIRQVLLNLLGNAIKFTASGSVTLRVHELAPEPGAVDAAAPRVTLRFEVQDSGIGIAPEHQARIFEPFTQADDSTTRRFGGTGLGLSIVRRLVDMMGGELSLHSVPGQGSTFGVTLPLALAPPA